MKVYEKPVVSVDAGMAEGVYAASGATGGVTVSDLKNVQTYWSGATDGTAEFTLNIINISQNNLKLAITFSSAIAGVWGSNASVSYEGSTTAYVFWYIPPTSAELTVKADNIKQLRIVSCSVVNN